ncbi:UDP-4-amino-4-deoxy-L-arabinose--oxoglutarate aminotransferase protein [Marine Group I thaumarchaeote SCGC AAA799-P11]|uniref:UDP-4-amino-4-deoxy-L-arabinose--oxoglutarate aminotransferase protein n=1 Tax=Marine Group I thaumarchaeote SCGC AAA799-P11 TaxID=1502295 RepID=A0A087S305_9ARCH|nr:UDP-4-amino-4-deoxy-L-arabinose--oxoglutarate aminotransferase protein [Marine Group I thaumarchaeote SCGC AAA799-P11]
MQNQFKIPWSKPSIGKEELSSLQNVIQSGWLTQGKITQEFETQLSEYLSSNVITVNNGSSALTCALLAHGLKPGDKVLVPNFTFFATYSIPKMLGADVILVDVDESTLNMNPENVEKIVKTQDVKMVIVVDVAGLPVDIDAFVELSHRYNFVLIEDAAEALGSEYKHQKIGSFDHTAIFSFHAAKQITTVEGGCVSSNNEDIVKKLNQIRDLGRLSSGEYVHNIISSNFRTTDLQSAIGIEQLKKIDDFLKSRSKIATGYKKNLKNFSFQFIPDYVTKHSYMMFFAFAQNQQVRNKYLDSLRTGGVDVRMPWLPLSDQPVNSNLNVIKFPNSKNIYQNSLTLPIYNSMKNKDLQFVLDTFQNFSS